MDSRKNSIVNRLTLFIEQKEPIIRERLQQIKDHLVQCLVDGTVYSIVESLKDLQRLQEENMFKEREAKLAVFTKDTPEYEEKALEIDLEILHKIDDIVKEQQSTLYCSGLAAFKVTEEPLDVKVQMEVISFILSIADIYSQPI